VATLRRGSGPVSDDFLRAVQAVYEERLDDFCSVVAAITRDRGGARDVVHDAFASALRSQTQYRGEGDLAAWIWKIVINTARDQRRRRQPDFRELTVEALDGAMSRQGTAADGSLGAAIQSLPERQRLAIFLRYYGDLEYRQIGEVMGITTGTVSAALNAAHRALIRQLNEVGQ
jgi:RNA polymerase sigma factor (sigma-70 family)